MIASLDNNRQLVIAFYEAFTAGAVERFDTLLAPDFINHPADPGRTNNVEGLKGGVTDFLAAFEDFVIQRDALIAEGDLVVCRITMSGRHVKPLGEWQPSHERVVFHGMDMHRIEAGRIAETWHFEQFPEA